MRDLVGALRGWAVCGWAVCGLAVCGWVVCGWVVLVTTPTWAHDFSLGRAELAIDAQGQGALSLDLSVQDIEELLGVASAAATPDDELLTRVRAKVLPLVRVYGAELPCPWRGGSGGGTPDEGTAPGGPSPEGLWGERPSLQRPAPTRVVLSLPFACGEAPDILRLDWGLSTLSALDLKMGLTVHGPDGVTLHSVLTRRHPKVRFRLREAPAGQILSRFFELGLAHILTGWDHLAFLLAILLQARALSRVWLFVSVFTLAHATTLTLTVLDLVRLPAALVEPAIALSIAAAAWHGLRQWRGGTAGAGGHPDDAARPVVGPVVGLLFAVGLVHGLGFSGLLLEALGPQAGSPLVVSPAVRAGGRAVVWPLLGFHLGLEAGQALFISLVFPLAWRLRTTSWAGPVWRIAYGALALVGVSVFVARSFF